MSLGARAGAVYRFSRSHFLPDAEAFEIEREAGRISSGERSKSRLKIINHPTVLTQGLSSRYP